MLKNKIENKDISTWTEKKWIDYTDIRLIDFGMSCKEDDCGVFVRGTPGYISPLIHNNNNPTGLCDVWSSTILFYQCI